MFKKILCTVMVCALAVSMLAGCKKDNNNIVITSENEDAKDAASVEEKELSADSVVVAVGEQTATYAEYLVYMYILKTKYQNAIGGDIWNYTLSENRSFKDVAKEQAISLISELKIISCKAENYGISLGTDEKEDIRKYVETIYQSASEEDKQEYMLTVDSLANVYMENEIAERVYNACIGAVDTNINDEDVRQASIQYMYIASGDINKAEKLRQKASKSGDFLSVARANTDAESCEMIIGRDYENVAFAETALSLHTGEMSGVLTTGAGCYVIYCVNENEESLTAQKKEDIIADQQRNVFETQYKVWAEEFNIQISPLVL